MKSKTLEKSETSLRGFPSGPAKGTIFDAAERIKPEPSGCRRSSCKNNKKFAVSSTFTVLHPTPALVGNSQLKRKKKKEKRLGSTKYMSFRKHEHTQNQDHPNWIPPQSRLPFWRTLFCFSPTPHWMRNTVSQSNLRSIPWHWPPICNTI